MAATKREKLKPASKASGKPSRKKADQAGMRTLREAAGKAVGENSEKITALLLQDMLDGKLSSGKLLLELAEKQPEMEDDSAARRERSTALELAAEPEWQEPVIEPAGETASESRDPKA